MSVGKGSGQPQQDEKRSGGRSSGRVQLGNLRSGCLASTTAENEEVRAREVEVQATTRFQVAQSLC